MVKPCVDLLMDARSQNHPLLLLDAVVKPYLWLSLHTWRIRNDARHKGVQPLNSSAVIIQRNRDCGHSTVPLKRFSRTICTRISVEYERENTTTICLENYASLSIALFHSRCPYRPYHCPCHGLAVSSQDWSCLHIQHSAAAVSCLQGNHIDKII